VQIALTSGSPDAGDKETPENSLVEAQQRLRRMMLA
jgi:hypothetical protein